LVIKALIQMKIVFSDILHRLLRYMKYLDNPTCPTLSQFMMQGVLCADSAMHHCFVKLSMM